LLGSIYSCGGACGVDALATALGHWPELAPVRSGAASILSSCLYFLALCNLMHCASRWFDHHGRLRFTIFCASKPIHCLPGSRHGPELQSCLPPVLFWTGNATAGIQFVAELRAKLWGAELKTKSTTMSMMSWAPAAPHTGKSGTIQTSSILFFPFMGPSRTPRRDRYGAARAFPWVMPFLRELPSLAAC